MDKKEMLEALKNLQRKIEDTHLSDYGLEDKVELLEAIFDARKRTESEIKYLTEKLSNDNNYIDRTPALYDEARRDNLEDYLLAAMEEEENCKESIDRYETLIEQLETNMEAQEKESARIVEQLNADLAEQSAELRDSLNMSDEEFEALRKSIDNNKMLRDAYSENIAETKKALERHKEKVAQLKEQLPSLEGARLQAEEILKNFDRLQKNRSVIDLAAKREDQERLKIYQANLKDYDAKERYVSYDYDNELSQIIDDYKNDRITKEQVIERVKEFRDFILVDFLDRDLEDKFNNEEVEENRRAQEICIKRIEALEKKLANDENYYPSVFVVERNNRDLNKLKAKIAKNEEAIKKFNSEAEAINAEIKTSDELIQELENQKNDIQRHIRRLGVKINPELEQQLLAQIASKNEDIAYLQTVKSGVLIDLEHTNLQISALNAKQARYISLRDKLEASLEKRNTVDASAKRLDEQELARLKASLKALERRENLIGVSLYEEFENIINDKTVKTAPEAEAEAAKKSSSNDDEKSKVAAFLNGIEKVKEKAVAQEPKSKTVEKEAEKNEAAPVAPVVAPNKGKNSAKDPLELGDTRGHQIKHHEEENENLKKKAQNKKFVGKLKKFFAFLTLIAAIVLAAMGLKSCSKQQADKILNDAQQNPSKYENMTPEEIQNTVTSEIEKGVEQFLEDEEAKEEQAVQKKTIDELANEVIRGLWGNDPERFDRLTAEGYNAKVVQNRVNEILKEQAKNNPQQNQTMTPEILEDQSSHDNNNNNNNNNDQGSDSWTDTTDDDISMEEQKEILADQGIFESEDVPPTTVVDQPQFDYDPSDENAYGGFKEEEIPQVTPEVTPEATPGTNNNQTDNSQKEEATPTPTPTPTPDTNLDDEWGEFVEEEVITPSGAQEEVTTETVTSPEQTTPETEEIVSTSTPDTVVESTTEDTSSSSDTVENEDTLTVNISTGESFNVNLGDVDYELNNSSRESNEEASSFIELDDTKTLTEDENGTVTLEIGGDSAEALKRDEPLTLEDIKRLREEFAAARGQEPLTQEDVDRINAEYQESAKSR